MTPGSEGLGDLTDDRDENSMVRERITLGWWIMRFGPKDPLDLTLLFAVRPTGFDFNNVVIPASSRVSLFLRAPPCFRSLATL